MNSKKVVNEYYLAVLLTPINQLRRNLLTNLLPVQFVRKQLKIPQPPLRVKNQYFVGYTCSTWLHRNCAGLSKRAFQDASNSNKPFLCSHCVIYKHEEEIASLKTTTQDLTDQLKSIQAKLTGPDSSCKKMCLKPLHQCLNRK